MTVWLGAGRQVVTKDYDDFRYAGKVQNFKFLKRVKCSPFKAVGRWLREDSFLLIPMKRQDTKVREGVCYLGRKIDALP